jgi:hypothetical protein
LVVLQEGDVRRERSRTAKRFFRRAGAAAGPAVPAAVLGLLLALLLAGCEDFITYQVWDGVPTIEPQAITLDSRETHTFVVSGGKPPYRFAIVSGGGELAVDGARALYTAPGSPGAAVIEVTDELGGRAQARVTVQGEAPPPPPPALKISPTSASLKTGETVDFQASGGTPPYAFSIVSGEGTIDAASGLYTAPDSPAEAVVQVADAQQATARATVQVTASPEPPGGPPLKIFPSAVDTRTGRSIVLRASGGTPPYSFSLVSGGGRLQPISGTQARYTAPGSPTEAVIEVRDDRDRMARSIVTVKGGG